MKLMANKGYIAIHRKIEDNPIWNSNEPFSKRDAWIDLILMVNHSDNSIVVGNEEITIKRGQKFTSVRKLSERWHWGKDKTLAYLRLLESMQMIIRYKTHNATLLTLVNYDKYQGIADKLSDTNKPTNPPHTKPTTKDTTKPQTIMTNNDINNDLIMKNKKPTASRDF